MSGVESPVPGEKSLRWGQRTLHQQNDLRGVESPVPGRGIASAEDSGRYTGGWRDVRCRVARPRARKSHPLGTADTTPADATSRRTGFTLIEVLASMAILLLLMLALVRMFDEASGALRKGTTSVARSAAARAAMEMITRDLEGAVIDRRFQFYKEANTVDVNYDEMYFVTMEGDPNDDRSYQLVRYYVRIQTNTYAGAKYFNFQLMRGAVSAATVKKSTGIDVLSLTKPEDNPGEWWGQINKANIWSPVRIADNIVRFDIYIHDDDGHLVGGLPGWIASNPKQDCYDSGNNSNYPSNTPPAFFDVYMQVTSDEAMKRGGLDLVAGNRREGISILYRESFLLTTRVHPATASAQVAHPSQY